MRIAVFARRSNPSTDPPILRKSRHFVECQVLEGLADWVDPQDHARGIICREFLPYSGRPREIEPSELPELDMMPPPDVGLRFVLPPSARHEILVTHLRSLERPESRAWAHEARSLRARRARRTPECAQLATP